MKFTKTFITIFLFTFLIGYVSVLPTKKEENISFETATKLIKNLPTPLIEQKTEQQINQELIDWQKEDESKLKIKLLETGEGFHGDQVSAKSGEIWLGLFKENNKYFLRSTKIKVRRSNDAVVDEPGEKTGKDVIVNGQNQPIFLLKNADILKEGEIKTLFYNPSDENLTNLENGFVANYQVNNNKYTLRVEGGANSSKLILETENTKQILYSVDKMGDATWSLTWVGDLDGDGKLDLYADLTDFYNFSEKRLFLSSQADKGKLIKQVANFWTNGC
ncbi:MAG: hypothetical protein ABJA66_02695 [Actinomycetota bacterium]